MFSTIPVCLFNALIAFHQKSEKSDEYANRFPATFVLSFYSVESTIKMLGHRESFNAKKRKKF